MLVLSFHRKMASVNADGHDLPPGWRWRKLGEVCTVLSGSTPKSNVDEYWSGDIIWITPTDLGQLTGRYIESSSRAITSLGYDSCSTILAPSGSVIMSTRAPIGHLAITTVASCVNQGCKIFVPSQEVDPEFLYFDLMDRIEEIRRLGAGATFEEVSKSKLESFQIPLPPLPEQKRIVAILNQQLAVVERAKKAAEERLEAARALWDVLSEHTLLQCGVSSWPLVSLASISEIVSGITLGRKLNSSIPTCSRPYLRVANVKDGFLDLTDVKHISATESECEKYILKSGDLLLTEGGDPDKLGRGCVWNEEVPKSLHQNHIFRVRFDQCQVNPSFVSAIVGSALGKSYFLANARRTTGIATINRTILGSFPVPVPSINQQNATVQRLQCSSEIVNNLLSQAERSAVAIDNIRSSLLQRAFSGET